MAQQTSVEWLVKQINGKSLNNVTIDIPKELIEQAKEMHEAEITKAYQHGSFPYFFFKMSPEDYYNETFKNETI